MGMMDFLKNAAKVTDDSTTEKNPNSGHSCVLCNGPLAEEKWAGQYWHKKCRRAARKMGKKMV